jgi:F-type H+-transporting ATPase subunit gamma
MAGGKEITGKIQSIGNTMKVTSALEKVSASKIRKSQDLMQASRPYVSMMQRIAGHLSEANPEIKHPFTTKYETTEKVGYIIVSTDRGLCGGLNSNMFKATLAHMAEWQTQDIGVNVVTLGKKASGFFKNIKVNIVGHVSNLGESPQIEDLIGAVRIMLNAYRDNEIQQLFVVYNDFINTMTQKPVVAQMLPLPPANDHDYSYAWDYIYEPDAKSLLDEVAVRYIEGVIYQAVLENLASEHAARMLAMKNATENAGDLIDELKLVFNKARQAAITQEISEIVGGAAAV